MKTPVYFVSYIHAGPDDVLRPGKVKNIVLEGKTPIDWLGENCRAYSGPPSSGAGIRILFWAEIGSMASKPDNIVTVLTRLGVSN